MQPIEFIIQTLNVAEDGLLKAVQDLTPYELSWRPGLESNPIGFLLWHITRSEDSLVSSLLCGGKQQVWETGKWGEKLGLAPDSKNTGNSYNREQVICFATPELNRMIEYHQAVRACTIEYLKTVKPADLEAKVPFFGGREVPASFVVSIVLSEIFQHSGQIAYVRGMLRGLNK
jgi:hypothetical protein